MIDNHMLKEIYKNETTEYLNILLQDLETFGSNEMDKQQVKKELERRKEEHAEAK
jgi:hypothetical protein